VRDDVVGQLDRGPTKEDKVHVRCVKNPSGFGCQLRLHGDPVRLPRWVYANGQVDVAHRPNLTARMRPKEIGQVHRVNPTKQGA
jgi:hypothetical protein